MKSLGRTIWMSIAGLAVVACVRAEDGYVESLGQQVVNLRAFKTPNTRIWLDFMPTKATPGLWFFGTKQTQTGSWLGCYCDSNGHFYVKHGDADGGAFVKLAPLDTERHTLYVAFNENGKGSHRFIFTTKGEEVLNTTTTEANDITTTGCPMMLFGLGTNYKNGEYAENRAPMKVYGVKIWEGKTLLHDYVPRKVEGKFYLKDLVDGKYVTGVDRFNGAKSTELLAGGGDIVEELGDAYIESHGCEQIDLGIKADGTTRIELDHELVGIAGENYLIGSRAMDGTSLTFWGYYAGNGAKLGYECVDGGPRWVYFSQGNSDGVVPAELRRTLVIDALMNRASYETAGYECSAAEITGSHVRETQANLGLFTVRSGTSWGGSALMKFYGLDVYKNGTLVKTYKPFVQNARAGVLDNDGNFLTAEDAESCTNQSFKIGGAMTGDAGMDDAFLETSGNEYVDSGWKPTANGKIVVDFALLDPQAIPSQYLLGIREENTYLRIEMDKWRMAASTGSVSWQYFAEKNFNRGRYQLTLDVAKGEVSLVQGKTKIVKSDLATPDPLPTVSLPLLCMRQIWQSKTSFVGCAKARLYSFKIYEGDSLVRSYYPATDENGEPGLYEKCSEVFVAPTKVAGAPDDGLKIRGRTVDGVDSGFAEKPPQKISLCKDDTATLTASASFATAYVWRRNGVVIKDETGPTCTVQYGGRKTDVYSVAPVYTVNRVVGSEDVRIEGDPAETEVTFWRGLSIIIR